MTKQDLEKELEGINLKIKERTAQLDKTNSTAWQLKALIKADEKHRSAIEKAIENLK
jgi:hypothetical protein